MKKLKVVTVVGTRPEIIRLSRVLAALDEHCEHVLVHTGQNYDYELNQIFFDDLGIRKPDHFLNSAGDNVRRDHRQDHHRRSIACWRRMQARGACWCSATPTAACR